MYYNVISLCGNLIKAYTTLANLTYSFTVSVDDVAYYIKLRYTKWFKRN